MEIAETTAPDDWRRHLPAGVRPYLEGPPIAAFFLGISSGFPFAMIGATLTTRLAQEGLDKKSITAFTLAREYFPNAELLINDYSITNDGNATTRYIEIINLNPQLRNPGRLLPGTQLVLPGS